MVVSTSINRSLVAVALLVGLVAAVGCEPGTNFPAVASRLDGAVAAGELTDAQGAEMKATLARLEFEQELNSLCEYDVEGRAKMVAGSLVEAVKAGEMSERMGWAIWGDYKEFDLGPRLKAAVAAGAMAEADAWALWMMMEKAEIGLKIHTAMQRGEITPEQARAKWEAVRRHYSERNEGRCGSRDGDKGDGLAGHYARMGIDADTLGRVKDALMERGIGEDQIEPVLGGMLRMVYMIKKAEGEFEMDPRMEAYFTDEIGLDAEQMELVTGMARRIAATCSRNESECGEKPEGQCRRGDSECGDRQRSRCGRGGQRERQCRQGAGEDGECRSGQQRGNRERGECRRDGERSECGEGDRTRQCRRGEGECGKEGDGTCQAGERRQRGEREGQHRSGRRMRGGRGHGGRERGDHGDRSQRCGEGDAGCRSDRSEATRRPHQRGQRRHDLERIKAHLAEAVEAGKITQEQADAKLAAMMERMEAAEDGVEEPYRGGGRMNPNTACPMPLEAPVEGDAQQCMPATPLEPAVDGEVRECIPATPLVPAEQVDPNEAMMELQPAEVIEAEPAEPAEGDGELTEEQIRDIELRSSIRYPP